MSTTVSAIQSLVNQYIRDSSTNSVSSTDRLLAISQGVQDIMTELGLDQMVKTYDIDFLDGINYYNVTSALPDFLNPVELRRSPGNNYPPFDLKDNRRFAVELSDGSEDDIYTVEIKNGNTYLGILHDSEYVPSVLHDCETYDGNGTWVADTVNSDATNVATDTNVFHDGSGSVSFDIVVAQSGNNRATISNSTLTAIDLTDFKNISKGVLEVYIPDSTYVTSVALYWGTDSSNYYLNTATTDIYAGAFADGWNDIGVNWLGSTQVGTPTITSIGYVRVDINYSASQADMSGVRIDNIRFIRPETLTLLYESSYIGTSNSGTKISSFTATTDIPFYSGMYDYFNNAVARRAAAILFDSMGLTDDYNKQIAEWRTQIKNIKSRFPHTTAKEIKSFRVRGVNLNK